MPAAARAGNWCEVEDVSGITEHWWLPTGYSFRSVLGRGSFGVVIEVVNEEGTLMAAKRIQLLAPPARAGRSHVLNSAAVQLLRRTLREIACLRRLQQINDPHIVRLIDTWTDLAVAEEVLGGRKRIPAVYMLFERLYSHSFLHGPLPARREAAPALPDVARILAQAVAGVRALHANRLLHRDLKPQNVLFTADGCVRLIDFGMVCAMPPAVAAPPPAVAPSARTAAHAPATAAPDEDAAATAEAGATALADAEAEAETEAEAVAAAAPPPPPPRRYSSDAVTRQYRAPELLIREMLEAEGGGAAARGGTRAGGADSDAGGGADARGGVHADADARAARAAAALDAATTGPHVDLWCVGCLLGEMLVRHQVHAARTARREGDLAADYDGVSAAAGGGGDSAASDGAGGGAGGGADIDEAAGGGDAIARGIVPHVDASHTEGVPLELFPLGAHATDGGAADGGAAPTQLRAAGGSTCSLDAALGSSDGDSEDDDDDRGDIFDVVDGGGSGAGARAAEVLDRCPSAQLRGVLRVTGVPEAALEQWRSWAEGAAATGGDQAEVTEVSAAAQEQRKRERERREGEEREREGLRACLRHLVSQKRIVRSNLDFVDAFFAPATATTATTAPPAAAPDASTGKQTHRP